MRQPQRPVLRAPFAFFVSLLGTAAFLSGCGGAAPLQHGAAAIGTHQAAQAPRIVITEHGTKHWDRPGAFGPVPAEWLQVGQEQCATLNHSGKSFVPLGYHAHAETADGYPFEDGGFFCRQTRAEPK